MFTAEEPRLVISNHSPSVSVTAFGSAITSLMTIWPAYVEAVRRGPLGPGPAGLWNRSVHELRSSTPSTSVAGRRWRRMAPLRREGGEQIGQPGWATDLAHHLRTGYANEG